MARPRMNRVLPAFASEFVDNRGTVRIRLRRTGWKSTYINAKPGTPEFTQAYMAWLEGGKIQVGSNKAAPGTFDDLIERFYRSSEWTNIKPRTQYVYRGELERFRAKYGNRPAARMTARNIANLMHKMSDRPSAANNLKKRLSQLFRLAIQLDWRTDNPAAAVRSLRIRSGGFQTWQEVQIEQFERHWAIGTMPRLAFDLALYTAQRLSDVRTMGPQHVKNGAIRLTQMKTGKMMTIPIHPELAKSIAAVPANNLAFLTRKNGAPFTEKGFGMWFMRQCRSAGLDGYSMHGLRKAASRRMAEAGLTNQQIKSITGHTGDAEVARYTREAEQAKIARSAVHGLASPVETDLSSNVEGIQNAR